MSASREFAVLQGHFCHLDLTVISYMSLVRLLHKRKLICLVFTSWCAILGFTLQAFTYQRNCTSMHFNFFRQQTLQEGTNTHS